MSRHGDIENLLKFMPNRRDLAHALLLREEELTELVERVERTERLLAEHHVYVHPSATEPGCPSCVALAARQQEAGKAYDRDAWNAITQRYE